MLGDFLTGELQFSAQINSSLELNSFSKKSAVTTTSGQREKFHESKERLNTKSKLFSAASQ